MSAPLFVRALTDDERRTIEQGLRSPQAFTLRRCQIFLASADGATPQTIATQLHCGDQTVRNAMHAFNTHGLAALQPGSSVPHTRPHAVFTPAAVDQLLLLLKRSPRLFGHATTHWTLAQLAATACAEGITPRRVSAEAIRTTLVRAGISWKRAKRWIHSPDPAYTRKKKRRDWLIALASHQPHWVVGFADEVWWSRFARPTLHAWQLPDDPLRLAEPAPIRQDRDPLALAWYGLYRCPRLVNVMPTSQLRLRVVAGRPVSAVTIMVLADWSRQLAAGGTTTLVLIWDNASWHSSRQVRAWIRQHNQAVKRGAVGVRLIVLQLPIKSPWLNPIEAKWVHGKRAIVTSRRLLTAQEIVDRACD